jgi:hypothetical protein
MTYAYYLGGAFAPFNLSDTSGLEAIEASALKYFEHDKTFLVLAGSETSMLYGLLIPQTPYSDRTYNLAATGAAELANFKSFDALNRSPDQAFKLSGPVVMFDLTNFSVALIRNTLSASDKVFLITDALAPNAAQI